jgi:hypothetical protein
MKLKEGNCGAAGTCRDFARAGSFGDTEQQADQQIAPEQSNELLGKFGRATVEQSGFLGAGHEFSQRRAARLTPYRIEGPRHLRGMDGLGDRQAENRYDGWIADLANKLSPERRQHMRERFAIAWHGQVDGHLQSPRAISDARSQHLLLVPDQRVKLSLGNARAVGDLERAGSGIAALHECREGGLKNTPAYGGFVAGFPLPC